MIRAAVYRLYNEDGTLIYVGCSINPKQRIPFHRWDKAWGKEIDRSRDKTTWYPSLEEAGFAEYEAIIAESPLYNARAQRYGVSVESLARMRRRGAMPGPVRCGRYRCDAEGIERVPGMWPRWCSAHADEIRWSRKALSPPARLSEGRWGCDGVAPLTQE